MNFSISCKAKDLLMRITEEWERQKKLDDVKQAFNNHRTHINNLSHSDYREFKRYQREHFNNNPTTDNGPKADH